MTNQTPIRRVLNRDEATHARAKRLAMLDQRNLGKSVDAIQERESQSQEIHVAEASHSRDDRKDVTLDESQEAAIDLICENQFAVVGGYAGTGKTTSVKYAISRVAEQVTKIDWMRYRSLGEESSSTLVPAIAFVTFSNVAARNLASKLPEEYAPHCMSIHSMLAFAPVGMGEVNLDTGQQKTRFEPRYHEGNKLPLKAIFIDEAGIVPRELWHQILDAVEPDTRIYFLGDLAQLPALQGVSPMPFAIEKWPTIVLDKIYRQADGSPLIENLTRIRKGLEPVHNAQVFRCGDKERLPAAPTEARRYIGGYISQLYKMGIWDPQQDMILTPENEATLGQEYWNRAFRFAFNPEKRDANNKLLNPPILMRTSLGTQTFAVGDKVMATNNGGRKATENRFVNGSIGTIVRIEPNPRFKGDMIGLGSMEEAIYGSKDEEHELTAQDMFDFTESAKNEADSVTESVYDDLYADNDEIGRMEASHVIHVLEQATGDTFILTRSSEVASIQHAYATTCHKFQGSQARNVLVICHNNMRFGHHREWLYTACSRAQQRVFLMFQDSALAKSVQKQRIVGRNAKEKAAHMRELYSKRTYAVPKLPTNRKLIGV